MILQTCDQMYELVAVDGTYRVQQHKDGKLRPVFMIVDTEPFALEQAITRYNQIASKHYIRCLMDKEDNDQLDPMWLELYRFYNNNRLLFFAYHKDDLDELWNHDHLQVVTKLLNCCNNDILPGGIDAAHIPNKEISNAANTRN